MSSNKTFKAFVDKMGGTQASNYIGNEGELFYDPETTTLRIADGSTPGGIVVSSGGGSLTGNIDITSTSSQINFVANSSGDGQGYSTIELIPDTNTTQDQYLIIDPTEPSHIHIRAGGPQDASGAELYLGGEKNNVRVTDGNGVRLQNEFSSDSYFLYTEGNSDFSDATWYEQSGQYYVQFTTSNPIMQNHAFDFNNDTDQNRLYVTYGETTSTLTSAGSASNLGGGVYRVGVNEAPPSSPTALTAIEFQLFTTRTNFLTLENNDFRVEVGDDLRMFASDTFAFYNYSVDSGIDFWTDYDNDSHRFSFRWDGSLEFPQGGELRVEDAVPLTSIGVSNDKANTLAFSNTHLYLCTADYDGITNIWKRVAWSNDTW